MTNDADYDFNVVETVTKNVAGTGVGASENNNCSTTSSADTDVTSPTSGENNNDATGVTSPT